MLGYRRNMSPFVPALLGAILTVYAPWNGQIAPKEKSPKDAATLPAVIWRDPGDVPVLDILNGAGGQAHAPDPHGQYTFHAEDLDGTSPKFSVRDKDGTEWRVKLGPEVQCETAATRLLWAAGYFVEETYYLPEMTVTGLPPLHRGRMFTGPAGLVRGARLKRHSPEFKKVGKWDWFDNPFLKTRELNGLRIMMSLLNNWDLKDVNNVVYDTGTERRYVVSDIGATLGNTGNYFTRSKSVLKEYAQSHFSDFARRPVSGSVDFVVHDRPFILTIFDFIHYRRHAKMEQIVKRIPRDDARWLGGRLAKLTTEQIKDCFRSAGYLPSDVDGFAEVIQKRIAELNALAL